MMTRRSLLGYTVPSLASMLALTTLPGGAFGQADLGSPQRIRHLKSTLAIRSSQAGPWSDYAAALDAYRAAVRDVREAEIQLMGGAQALDGDNDAMLNERRDARLLAKATLQAKYETFYAVLDPAQQRTADATLTAGECGK